MKQLSKPELESALDHFKASPSEEGKLEMIVRRPAENLREVLTEGKLTTETGLTGDNWASRGSSKTEDGSSHPDMQLNIMNARVIQHIAGDRNRWPLAGDQLFVDLDLSQKNLPPGTQLQIGEATIEVTSIPHMGCHKFVDRFGMPAMQFVNSRIGRELHLRGINAKVIKSGLIREGDAIRKL